MTSPRKKHRPGQVTVDFEKSPKENKIPISKLDAACRQLETAVSLWFHNGDPVSIHTLTMAAHEILRVLNGTRGGPPMIGEPSSDIREEYTDAWRELCSRSAAFFKHSSRDAAETHYFAPDLNAVIIVDATDCYKRLTGEERPLFRLFKWYMRLHFPRFFVEKLPVNAPDLKAKTKPEFFSELIGMASDPASLEEQCKRFRQLLEGNDDRREKS